MAHPSGLYFTMREEPDTQSNVGRFARLSAIQGGMRQAFTKPFSRVSSLYSRGTNVDTNRIAPGSTPPLNMGGFFGQQSNDRTGYDNESSLNLPLHSQPFGQNYSPVVQPSEWGRAAPLAQPLAPPEPAVLSTVASHETLTGTTTNSTETSRSTHASRSSDRERRRRRKHRRHHRHHHDGAWVRPHRSGTTSSRGRRNALHPDPKRGQNIYVTTTVASLFLLATAVTYAAIAVSVRGLGQELHILFIITLVGAFIFLLHSLWRLRVAKRRQRARQARERAKNAANFSPTVPIRVHMAHDEDIEAQNEDGNIVVEKVSATKIPPPAYGLWRSSVKVNPHLLFWQRVEMAKQKTSQDATSKQGPRPPSYLSDDGVSYVVGAAPRSTVQLQRPPTELHPAFRQV